MRFSFSEDNIKEIATTLEATVEKDKDSWTFQMHDVETRQSLVFMIYNNIDLGGDEKGSLVSVQTQHGYFEIHFCNGYMVFEPDEIIFFEAKPKTVSCLIVGRKCTCSMFSNINRSLLNADFTTLDPPVLLSAMQLSLTEDVLPSG
jgi:hypothetical protein